MLNFIEQLPKGLGFCLISTSRFSCLLCCKLSCISLGTSPCQHFINHWPNLYKSIVEFSIHDLIFFYINNCLLINSCTFPVDVFTDCLKVFSMSRLMWFICLVCWRSDWMDVPTLERIEVPNSDWIESSVITYCPRKNCTLATVIMSCSLAFHCPNAEDIPMDIVCSSSVNSISKSAKLSW